VGIRHRRAACATLTLRNLNAKDAIVATVKKRLSIGGVGLFNV
jgi:hypothetical protein